MTPHEFCSRWSAHLNPADRDQFLLELAVLLTHEQALERRRFLGHDAVDATGGRIKMNQYDVRMAVEATRA